MRRAEIAGLRLSDIKGNVITIRGKGHGVEGKVVEKVMPKAVVEIINDYLPHRSELLKRWGNEGEDILLISEARYNGKPLGNEALGDAVRDFGKENNLEMSTHTLRRFYATSLRDAGVDLDTIRRMMRHTQIDTTVSYYLSVDPGRMAKANEDIDTLLFG